MGCAIRELLPNDVAFVGGPLEDARDPLFAIEERYIVNAVAKRRAEFVAGRTYARKALALLGVAPAPIAVGTQREPQWPADVVGSIAHCEGYCGAISAWRNRYSGLGFDVEPERALEDELIEMIAAPSERAQPIVTFCIKESFYKAYFPLARTFLAFADALVELHEDGGFALKLVNDAVPSAAGTRLFHGRYVRASGLVAAWTLIPAP